MSEKLEKIEEKHVEKLKKHEKTWEKFGKIWKKVEKFKENVEKFRFKGKIEKKLRNLENNGKMWENL